MDSVKASFTRRETEIADLLSRGLSEKEIAEKLNVSSATVNNHTRNIREKFGLSKSSEIILLYISIVKGKPFNLNSIRKLGIGSILIFLNVCDII